jgi:hypothetical protein
MLRRTRVRKTESPTSFADLRNHSCGNASFNKVDGGIVTMLLSSHAIKNPNNKGGGSWPPPGSPIARPTDWRATVTGSRSNRVGILSARERVPHNWKQVPTTCRVSSPNLEYKAVEAQLIERGGIEKTLYQTAETLTHLCHRRVRAPRPYPIGPPYVFAMDVRVGRSQHESGSASFGISAMGKYFAGRKGSPRQSF